MAIYKVKAAQNIWDIALAIYGSIEGVFDLLISNPRLTMHTELKPNMELEYHEGFVINRSIVEALHADTIIPANGDRGVYFKSSSEVLKIIFQLPMDEENVKFSICGQGEMQIDWGDNSSLEAITLTNDGNVVEHFFDNRQQGKRLIKIYGEFEIEWIDMSASKIVPFTMQPVTVDEVVSRANSVSLDGLFLFKGTKKVDLKGSRISSLRPLINMSLQELDLRDVIFKDINVLDDYLELLVTEYGVRRGCTVYLSEEPTDRGMAAIDTILGEEEWNAPHPWHFIIKENEYTPNGTDTD